MSQFELTVKWGKQKFPKIEVDTNEPPEIFKAQLFALTNVPPERQKIMMKGSTLKDSWSGFESKLKNGVTILLMGSADPLPEAPKEQIKFLEDMTEGEANKALQMPPGLVNLGNTCYLNSVIQCLRTIPELREAIMKMDHNNAEGLLIGLSNLWKQMDDSGEAANPILLLSMIHSQFPQFAERDPKGGLKQQDANEAWLALVRYLQLLKGTDPSKDVISQTMGIKLKRVMKCAEEGGETDAKIDFTEELSLSCFIDQNVKYLMTGLQSQLKEQIEKRSDLLDRNAKHEQVSTVVRLPQYVAINFIRFYYKQDKNVSAKILKDVKFPEDLDLWDVCDDSLKEKLKPQREKLKEIADKEMEIISKKKRMGVKKIEKLKYSKFEDNFFPDDIGSNSTGWYNLKAVLTHQGRSSDAGHYIGWTRNEEHQWVKFDDDKTSSHTVEEILALSGGGDWHTAYICLYEAKKLPVFTPDLDDTMEA